MTGTIQTTCPNCCNKIRVQVIFPKHNAGFISKQHTCQVCGTQLLVTDPHDYNEDGTIK